MFVVIQEVQTKTEYLSNTFERIISTENNHEGTIWYGYKNDGKRFVRPKKAIL